MAVITNKLAAWASSCGLGDDVANLKSRMTAINMVLGSVQGKDIKNKFLAKSLVDLEQLLFDTDEVLDELDYYRLQEEVEEGGTAGTATLDDSAALTLASSSIFQLVTDPLKSYKKKTQKATHPTHVTTVQRMAPDGDVISCRIKEILNESSEILNPVKEALELEKLDSISSAIQSMPASRCMTTACHTERKVFGRDREREEILELLMGDTCVSQTLSVLPIVGNGGIGKTTLARLVYNDPRVADWLHIWICVSVNFDEFSLTREILDCITTGHQNIMNFDKLQQILQENLKSKRFLLVLDDMWEDKKKSKWDRLLAPLYQSQVKGNMILATTRKPSVAKMIGTMDPISLDGLKGEYFWKFFKACAFGDENCKGHKNLHRIGRQIAERLKGYPLAAKSVGALLRNDLTVEHWRRILENREWISQQDTDGLIPILRPSYDYLPLYLQRCFRYCSLFPKNYRFDGEDLVRIWISQGFVHSEGEYRGLEEVGCKYLNDLINLGFFQKVDEDTNYIHCLMHDLIHDLAQSVSSNECFTLDGSQHIAVPSTVRHLSIIPTSADSSLEEMVELNGLQTEKLKSLLLFGDANFICTTNFQHVFEALKNVRTIKLSGIYHLCNFEEYIHLRYLRITLRRDDMPFAQHLPYTRHFPKELCRLYHLQFLDVGEECHLSNLPRNFTNLVNLRHFIADKENHSEIGDVGKLACLQELHEFKTGKDSFRIGQLGKLAELRSLCIYDMENVETKIEANNARLSAKKHLRKLCLFWGKKRADARPDAEEEVLEGLQPHPYLEHLQISGYNGATSPTWLGSLTSLQSLYLEDCSACRTLPPFLHFCGLKKLRLSRICGVSEVSTHSLEEMVIQEVAELESWVVKDKDALACKLQALQIKSCPKLRELPLSHCSSSQDKETLQFPHLRQLIIEDCRCLMMPLPPLPLGPKVREMSINKVGSSLYKRLSCYGHYKFLFLEGSNELRTLDGILAFHNLGDLEMFSITSCPSLTCFSWEGFKQLTSLKHLSIYACLNLFSMCTAQEEQNYGKDLLLPSLERLEIDSCRIIGNHLTRLLSHLPSLSYFRLRNCSGIASSLAMDEHGDEGILIPASEGWEIASLVAADGSLTPKRYLRISNCPGLRGFVFLEELLIYGCSRLLPSKVPEEEEGEHQNSNGSCPVPSSLQELSIYKSPDLEFLDLHSCTALEKLTIEGCGALSSLQGLQSCIRLRVVSVSRSPGFWGAWNLALQEQERVDQHDFCPPLEEIRTDDLSFLTICICKHLASLQSLYFFGYEDDKVGNLTKEQEEAFLLLTSLQELQFHSCKKLRSLPAALHLSPYLKKLEISICPGIQSLKEQILPPSLEELVVNDCENLHSLPVELNLLHSLKKLSIQFCRVIQSLKEQALPLSLKNLVITVCENLHSLPEELHLLPSLKTLEIKFCPGIQSLKEQALPLSLENLVINDCENLQSLPAGLHLLPSLNKLVISYCPSIQSLPERGLPPSLEELFVQYCSEELRKQCIKIKNIKKEIC